MHYDVPGSARKILANAIGEAIGADPEYQAAPTFAYLIGDYSLDQSGALTGPHNDYLMGFLPRTDTRPSNMAATIPAILMPGVVVQSLHGNLFD